jgi:error-prone DNA polymerase
MPEGEHVIHDYKTMSHSLKAHPVAFLRHDFDALGIVPTAELLNIPNGRQVTVAGLVLVRQRPGSAKGVIFMTIEDETGIANAIIWQNVFGIYRPVVMGARLVSIRGKLQKADNVIHVVAEHVENLSGYLTRLLEDRPDIPTLSPSDELRRPTGDHRQRKKEMIELRDKLREQAEMASNVMPEGRNFH